MYIEKGMATHSIFLPGKSHGQRSLAGYSPWVVKEGSLVSVIPLSLPGLAGFIIPPEQSGRPVAEGR